MYYFLLTILILDAFLLMTVVLLQAGKGGGLAAMGGGGSGSDSMFGSRQATTLLTKTTWWTGGIFLGIAFILSMMSSQTVAPESILRGTMEAPAAAPTLPDAVQPLLNGAEPVSDAEPGVVPGGESVPGDN